MITAIVVVLVVALVLAATGAASSVRVLREYERAVVFRLGRLMEQRGPGLQTLREIGATQNSTVAFPVPIDLVKPALDALSRPPSSAGQAAANGEAAATPNGELHPAPGRALNGGALQDADAAATVGRDA